MQGKRETAVDVPLNSFESLASLIVFALVIIGVIILVVRPVKVHLPDWLHHPFRRTSIHINYALLPVIGALLLLAFRCLTIEQLWLGIKGNDNINPYAIVILFMSLAYIAYSLDNTGGLSWLALHITARSKGNGRYLFIFYYILAGVMTTFTSNDIVIMTITPIILHFAKSTGAQPMPYLVAMFSSANLWSMSLIISNPTNIIAGEAFNMTFLEYSKWMVLPTLVAGICMLFMLYWRFNSQIPAKLQLPEVHPNDVLRDGPEAIIGSVLMLSCIGIMAAAPSLGWELWPVALVFAAAHACFNLVRQVLLRPDGVRCMNATASAGDSVASDASASASLDPTASLGASSEVADGLMPPAGCSVHHHHQAHHSITLQVLAGCSSNASQQLPEMQQSSKQQLPGALADDGLSEQQGHHHQRFQDVWLSLPWEIIPFVLGMFVMVEGLAVNGWVDACARALASASTTCPVTLFLFAAVSVVLANVVNNQPMTILMTRVCLSSAFSGVVSSRSLLAALLAVITASNLGANVTMVGALAGIMWAGILGQKGLHVGYLQFTRLICVPGLACVLVTLLVLWAELALF